MARPKNHEFDLKQRIQKLKDAGFSFHQHEEKEGGKEALEMEPLPVRIKHILKIIQSKPIKSTRMNYLILYDIENNKIRGYIAKYLLEQGCIRIQKSVYLAHLTIAKFDELHQTLVEINEIYDNEDSIILVPLNISDARSMKLIGKEVNVDQIVDPPNTIFL